MSRGASAPQRSCPGAFFLFAFFLISNFYFRISISGFGRWPAQAKQAAAFLPRALPSRGAAR